MPAPSVTLLLTLPFASASILATYFYIRPLPLATPRQITQTRTLSPSCTSPTTSSSFRIINPRNHIFGQDSHSIALLKSEIGEMSDEEILARFLRGFYDGWSFMPEKGLFAALGLVGKKILPVGFTDMPTNGPPISSPSELSRTKLPEKHSRLLGSWMFLDIQIRNHALPSSAEVEKDTQLSSSYVDLGFGDDRKGFSGVNRFEVTRDEGGITICYSSCYLNPTVDKMPFPELVDMFHRWYAMCLFRDAVEGVLRT